MNRWRWWRVWRARHYRWVAEENYRRFPSLERRGLVRADTYVRRVETTGPPNSEGVVQADKQVRHFETAKSRDEYGPR